MSLLLLAPQVTATESSSPLAPDGQRATMHLADDRLTIELVASEPQVINPVACAWDADGRLYVAEMRDYPVGPAGGTIKQLIDGDGDGRYETTHLFADRLNFPNGVLPWRGGVLVTAAPDILFLRDEDGDGRAEHREVLLTGFAEGNQQLRVNGLLWGLDGWVYGANGRSDGQVRRPGDKTAVSLRRHDFRFRPETGDFEVTMGFSQFGLARDDWGNRFLSWNVDPLRHVVIEEWYLNRNPSLVASGVEQLIDAATSGQVYPRSRPPQTFNRESVRHFNASCGVTIYRGDCLPNDYHGNALVCEPLTNLVHRRLLRPMGATFIADRAPNEASQEFLAATDPWFRPVNLATGPDGALYVVDFYRKWVEHPQFVPEKLRAGVDFRTGDDRGRIWRIRGRTSNCGQTQPRLSNAADQALVEALGAPNGWRRDTAQRLLLERGKPACAEAISRFFGRAQTPQGRVQALWAIAGLGRLDDSLLQKALSDESPRVREQAIKLAESRLGESPKLLAAVLPLLDDADPRVRFQLTLSLAGLSGDQKLPLLTKLAASSAIDRWEQLAIVGGLYDQEIEFLRQWSKADPKWLQTPGNSALLSRLGELVGNRNRDQDLAAFLDLSSSASVVSLGQFALWAGLARGLEQAGAALVDRLPQLKKQKTLDDMAEVACSAARSAEKSLDERILAIDILSQVGTEAADQALLELLSSSQPRTLQIHAAQAIGQRKSAELATAALERFREISIPARRELLTACCRTRALAATLLQAVEAGRVSATDVDFSQRIALLAAIEPSQREHAESLFGKDDDADRTTVVNQYMEAAKLAGDRARGAIVFAQSCSVCHLIQGYGTRVGPELTGISSRAPAALLTDILDPSREVPTDFLNYLIETKDGQILSGLIAAENAAAITLRGSQAAETVVKRERIERIQSTGKSLMPDGLEQKLSRQQMADLLAFLAQPDRALIPANQ